MLPAMIIKAVVPKVFELLMKQFKGIDKIEHLVKYMEEDNEADDKFKLLEKATVQLADEIETLIKPKALAVVVKAKHLCMSWRGVKDNSSMSTSVMRGLFKDDNGARNEFLNIIKGQEY